MNESTLVLRKGVGMAKRNKHNKRSIERSVAEELEIIDIDKEIPDQEVLEDVNDDDSFDDAFLDALDSIPDDDDDGDFEPVIEPEAEELSEEEKYLMDKPLADSKDDLDEEEETKPSAKKKEKKSDENIEKVKKDYNKAVSKFFKEHGIMLAILLVFVGLVVAGLWYARNGEANNASAGPLGPVRDLQNAKEESFVKVTGLDQLKVDDGQAVASIVSWANASVTASQLVDADFDTRLLYAMSGAYVEILCDDGYIFIDSDYGVLMIVPYTDGLARADKDENARTTIWFADLWDETLALRPADIDAQNAIMAIRSADGLGEFLKAAVQADDSTLLVQRNELISSYGVDVKVPTEIPAVLTWGDQMGYEVRNWKIFLSGLGDAVHDGASIFNYVLRLDENTPPIQVVDDNGEPAGESKDMMLFNLYGIYLLSDGFELPEGLKSVTIDDTTGEWSTEVTEEEWKTLFQHLQSVHATVLNYSGMDTMDATYQQMMGDDVEEGVGNDGEGIEEGSETESEEGELVED